MNCEEDHVANYKGNSLKISSYQASRQKKIKNAKDNKVDQQQKFTLSADPVTNTWNRNGEVPLGPIPVLGIP